jgi:Zn-dependent protease with chaperone function
MAMLFGFAGSLISLFLSKTMALRSVGMVDRHIWHWDACLLCLTTYRFNQPTLSLITWFGNHFCPHRDFAVMLVLGIILNVTGIAGNSTGGILIMAMLFGFAGSLISLFLSKTMALRSVGACSKSIRIIRMVNRHIWHWDACLLCLTAYSFYQPTFSLITWFGILIMAMLFGFAGSLISLFLSKTMALRSVGAEVITEPCTISCNTGHI